MSDLHYYFLDYPFLFEAGGLEMLHIHVEQPTMVVHLETEEGFNFHVLLKNERDHTFFGCPRW